ncbi:MAG: MerR family DNA-binding protein, partial [Chloroflexota bacterium]|nr:MerR family DNA-binding protein [Chloroflexota bacterium]
YYSAVDVRRLRLVGRLRRLGLPLADAGVVAERAFAAECRTYVRDVGAVLERQCREIDRQVAELRALRTELAELAALAHEAEDAAPVGKRVAECDACPVVDAVADSDAGPAVAPESSELPARRAPVRVVRRTAEVDGIR